MAQYGIRCVFSANTISDWLPTFEREGTMTFLSDKDSRARYRRTARAVVGAVPLLALALAYAPAAGASASGSTNALVFTGALTGTLKIGPNSGCDASANGVTLSSFTTSLSSKKYKTWSISVFVTKLGTYMKFKFLKSSFVLETSNLTAWVATSGKITITSDSGTVNLTLGAHEGAATGTVHVKGSWNCKA
jgi:hypothetical protein